MAMNMILVTMSVHNDGDGWVSVFGRGVDEKELGAQ